MAVCLCILDKKEQRFNLPPSGHIHSTIAS